MGKKLVSLGLGVVLATAPNLGCRYTYPDGRYTYVLPGMQPPKPQEYDEYGNPKPYEYHPGRDLSILGWVLGANAAANSRMKPNQRAAAGYTADLIRDYGVAEAGRSNVQQNVNVGSDGRQGNFDQGRSFQGNRFFACNLFSDRNGDGVAADDLSEFVGIKKSFSRRENVYVVANIRGRRGSRLTLKMVDGYGNAASKNFGIIRRNNEYICQSLKMGLRPGRHTGEWYVDGQLVGQSEVRIGN